MEFKVGDVVVLKSGGPPMTIYRIMSQGSVWCTWFDGSGKPTDKEYPVEALSYADDWRNNVDK